MNRGFIGKGAISVAAGAAAVALCLISGGCAPKAYESVPGNHLDADGQIEFNHERCGACHIGAQRGNPSFLYSEGNGNTDVYGVEIPEQIYDLPDAGYLPPAVNLD